MRLDRFQQLGVFHVGFERELVRRRKPDDDRERRLLEGRDRLDAAAEARTIEAAVDGDHLAVESVGRPQAEVAVRCKLGEADVAVVRALQQRADRRRLKEDVWLPLGVQVVVSQRLDVQRTNHQVVDHDGPLLSTVVESAVAPANEEAVEAWNGVLFDRFVQYRDVLVGGLGAHGDFALEQYPPAVGDNVLDVGCGFGDSTRQIGELVGPGGSALGNDVAERFIALATEEAAQAGVENVSFFVSDIQAQQLEAGAYDYVFSRFGTMFFANPVAALRNIRQSLVPGDGSAWSSGARNPTTSGCTVPSWRSRSSWITPIPTRPTSRPADPGRSRWRTRTPSAASSSAPAMSGSSYYAQTSSLRSARRSRRPSSC